MSFAFYLSHPEIVIDPETPVPLWSLSDTGRARAERFATIARTKGFGRIVSSTETKALETATIIADRIGLVVESDAAMGENDRSATGFVPPQRFETLADAFFAKPEISVMGWETARDAQRRIVAAVENALAGHDCSTPILLVGHGAVGTLLRCHLAGRPIDRRYDQKGGGNGYCFSLASREVLCEWTSIEDWEIKPWPER